ncbi:hypothetical protein QQ045_002920 [Rhodiola kirilowii]
MEELVRERQWMYNQRNPGESWNNEVFMYGVGHFLGVVTGNGQICDGNKLQCPCSKCKNKYFREIGLCETHLFTYEFVKDYYNWTNHGEEIAVSSSVSNNFEDLSDRHFQNEQTGVFGYEIDSRFDDMICDMAGPCNTYNQPESVEPEEQSEVASELYELFKFSCEPVFEGCTSETQLSIVMKMLQIKTDHGLSEAAYASICTTIGNLLDCEHRMPTTFRQTKKLVSGLGMGYTRIDVCVNGCMIDYGEDENLSICRFCGEPRYKETREQERSNSYERISRDPDVMVHPADGKSWKHFDRIHPDFSCELRNGRLGCPYYIDDTKTFVLKNGRKVSYFDCYRRFLPVGHPYRENRRSFYRGRAEYSSPIILQNGNEVYERVCGMKTVFEQIPDEKLDDFGNYHNWTKKSIFWELPYWKDMRLRHNLDVMHIEKNIFENLFNTIMNVKGKTKDNGTKCRKDVGLYCERPELELRLYCGNHVDLQHQRLMPIAFCGMLPTALWESVSELCTFFRDTCASSLDIQRMTQWNANIIEPIYYLGPEFKTNARRLKRNEVIVSEGSRIRTSIFNYHGSESRVIKRRVLSEAEFLMVTHYVYSNTPKFEYYINWFENETRQNQTEMISLTQMEKITVENFPTWMQNYFWKNNLQEVIPEWIQEVSMGFDWYVRCKSSYKVNNFKFHTELESRGRRTKNCHIHVKGTEETHYYGVLEEIINYKFGHLQITRLCYLNVVGLTKILCVHIQL